MNVRDKSTILRSKNGTNYALPFIIITSLFALWGFANDITNPLVATFQTVMEISAAKASLVQFAFMEVTQLWQYLPHYSLENIVIKME